MDQEDFNNEFIPSSSYSFSDTTVGFGPLFDDYYGTTSDSQFGFSDATSNSDFVGFGPVSVFSPEHVSLSYFATNELDPLFDLNEPGSALRSKGKGRETEIPTNIDNSPIALDAHRNFDADDSEYSILEADQDADYWLRFAEEKLGEELTPFRRFLFQGISKCSTTWLNTSSEERPQLLLGYGNLSTPTNQSDNPNLHPSVQTNQEDREQDPAPESPSETETFPTITCGVMLPNGTSCATNFTGSPYNFVIYHILRKHILEFECPLPLEQCGEINHQQEMFRHLSDMHADGAHQAFMSNLSDQHRDDNTIALMPFKNKTIASLNFPYDLYVYRRERIRNASAWAEDVDLSDNAANVENRWRLGERRLTRLVPRS